MSKQLHFFESNARRSAVELPFDQREMLEQWRQLRSFMIRDCPAPFTRDEWAYLIGFLGTDSLTRPFSQAFGTRVESPSGPVEALFRPRGPVAVWLPGNVSLLGPLVLVLVSLTGNAARFKASSKAEDLSAVLHEFATSRLSKGPLVDYLTRQVALERFERDDARNRSLAAGAAVRIFFGSDAGAAAVEALPHPLASIGFAFTDHQSESWIEPARVDAETLTTLLRVFTIYGQAGCTSPRRLVVLDGTLDDCRRIRDELLNIWPHVQRGDPPMHVASANIMARQLAAATGWDAKLAARQRGVVAVGDIGAGQTPNLMTLSVVPATPEQAVEHLPENIQTIGHALVDAQDARWLRLIVQSKVKRFVPIAAMHYFGPTWDGWGFWQQMFEEVVVAS
jgi:hypothetical protein